jgi:hypothetical protein
MNRIILIGNGFDLAHDIQTSYTQFLDDYWEVVFKKIDSANWDGSFKNDQLLISGMPRRSDYSDFNYNRLKQYFVKFFQIDSRLNPCVSEFFN